MLDKVRLAAGRARVRETIRRETCHDWSSTLTYPHTESRATFLPSLCAALNLSSNVHFIIILIAHQSPPPLAAHIHPYPHYSDVFETSTLTSTRFIWRSPCTLRKKSAWKSMHCIWTALSPEPCLKFQTRSPRSIYSFVNRKTLSQPCERVFRIKLFKKMLHWNFYF